MYIISACLLGKNCKYNGGNNLCEKVVSFVDKSNYIAVCPEVAGGLKIPRDPSEIRHGKVYDKNGNDLTEAFIKGAEKEIKAAKRMSSQYGEEIDMAILKSKSPSCGVGTIYDGTFSGHLESGDGIFAHMLRKKGIKMVTEEDFK